MNIKSLHKCFYLLMLLMVNKNGAHEPAPGPSITIVSSRAEFIVAASRSGVPVVLRISDEQKQLERAAFEEAIRLRTEKNEKGIQFDPVTRAAIFHNGESDVFREGIRELCDLFGEIAQRRCRSIIFFQNIRSYSGVMHRHSFPVVNRVFGAGVQGSVVKTSENEYQVAEGDVLFIPPLTLHSAERTAREIQQVPRLTVVVH